MRQHLLPALAALSLGGCGFFDLSNPLPPGNVFVVAYPEPSMLVVAPAPAAAPTATITIQLLRRDPDPSLVFEAQAYGVEYLDPTSAGVDDLMVPRTALPTPVKALPGAPMKLALELASPAVVAWGRAHRVGSLNARVTLYASTPAGAELPFAVPIRFD